jgi:hypothetical protein
MDEISLPSPPFKGKAGVVKLVDTLDLGSSAARLGGSSPSARTAGRQYLVTVFFYARIACQHTYRHKKSAFIEGAFL